MAFPVRKELKLDFLGAEWAGAYIAYRALTFKETRGFSNLELDNENANSEQNMEAVLELLQGHFIEGKAYDGNQLVDLTVDDLENLPVDVIGKSVEALAGGISENLNSN